VPEVPRLARVQPRPLEDAEISASSQGEAVGAGAQPVAEGISNMKITRTGRQYTIALTGRSELRDPISGSWLTRSLQATVSLRNGIA
jgi:hypothetical protein